MPQHLTNDNNTGTHHGVSLQPMEDNGVGTCHGMSLRKAADDYSRGTKDCIRIHNTNQFSKPLKNSVSVIINQFKSSVKRWCNKNGFINFEWQPRFYDRIVFEENAFQDLREYIINNPSNWENDELNI